MGRISKFWDRALNLEGIKLEISNLPHRWTLVSRISGLQNTPKRGLVGACTGVKFLKFGTPAVNLERVKLVRDNSHLTDYKMATKGCGGVQGPNFTILGPL